MKVPKIIGIIGYPGVDNENDSIISVYKRIKDVVLLNKHIPIIICPFNLDKKLSNKEKKYYDEVINKCDGLIIQGGYKWYEFTKYVVQKAIELDIPVLGICLGMQLLSVIDTGYNNLKKINSSINHKTQRKYSHYNYIKNNTLLKKIVKKNKIKVNSKHQYQITKLNNFIISAVSEDNVIEAIELPNKKFILGTQWHPEANYPKDKCSRKIFKCFFNSCNK